MGEVINAPIKTTLDLPVEKVLAGAVDANLDLVIVIGHDECGEPYFASSIASSGDILWWLEVAKKRLLQDVS